MGKSIREVYGTVLAELGDTNENIVVLDADLSGSTKSGIFAKAHPERHFNMGIAESDMVATAAGLATTGKIPFVNTFTVFLTTLGLISARAQVCYGNLNVKFGGAYCGMSDALDGATHHATEDIAVMRALPNMTVLVPSDATSTRWATKCAVDTYGPMYLRLSRDVYPDLYDESTKFECGKGAIVRDGTDVTVIACGILVHKALEAAEQMAARGVSVRVVDMYSIKPIDRELILRCAQETGAIVTAEEHNIYGGLGSAVAEVLAWGGTGAPTEFVGIPDTFTETGKYTDLKATVDGLSSEVKKDTKITGGGNLILGSESFKNAALQGGGTVEYNDDGSATVTNSNSLKIFDFNTTSTRIVKGVTLCISVMYKQVSGKDAFYLDIHYSHANGSRYYTSIKPADQIKIEQSDGWVLRYGTWTPKDNYILTGVRFGLQSGSVTNKYMALHPMLQYGNAPTAWTASSGDYITEKSAKSLISQSADEIKTEVTKSVTETVTANVKDTATSAANDAVDSKLQDYATTATVNSLKADVSSISQKADNINTKVSSLEETTTTISNDLDSTKREFKTVKESVSAIDQKADSITQTVTQRITGGNNIIAGTDNWNNATLDAGGNDLNRKGSYTIDGESVRVTNRAQNTRFHFGADKTLVIAKGMTYCASVLYKLNSGTDSLFLQFETKSSSGAKSYYGNAFKNAKQDIELDNGWKLRWAAFTATADGYADGLFISTADDNATVTNDLTIMHPMVQMGNAPTAWTASSGDYLTTTETKTEIKQTVSEIKLTASTSGTSSTIKLTAGGTEITSAQINLSGVVTFSDLSTWNQDKTIINGGNITTGQIHNKARTTTYDLDNAWIRMGKDAGTRVDIDTGRIRWYWENNLTGVLSSRYGKSYIGDNSRYTFLGWFSTGDPSFDYSTGGATSEFVGIAIDQVDKVIHCNASKFEIPGRIECGSLSVNGREI